MANNQQATSANTPKGNDPKHQGVNEMYDDPEEGDGGQEGEEQPTFGDRISNAGNNLSQDYQDVNALSDNKLDDLVKDQANTLKDRYFPKKDKAEEDGEGEDQQSSEDSGKDGQNADEGEPQADGERIGDQSDQASPQDSAKTDKPGQETGQNKPQANSQDATASDNPNLRHNDPDYQEAPLRQPGASQPQSPDANFSMDSLGQASDKAQKTAELVNKAEQGTQAFNAGVELGEGVAATGEAAAVGSEAAAATVAGAPTGGVGAAVVALGAAAIKGTKAAYKAFREGLKLKEKAEAAGRLFKRWWWCGCIVFIPLIILIGGFVFIYENILHLDTLSKIGKAIVSIFKHNRTTNNITFTDPNSADAIENGEMGKNASYALSSIATGKKSTVTFKGTSTITGKENEPYEFDVITYDTIKCALGADKLPEIIINLSPKFSWSSQIIPGKENAICSTDYFPGIDSVTNSSFSALGPGEFMLKNIAASGPKATKQKTMEVIDKVVSANVEGVSNDGQVPMNKIILSTEVYNAISGQIINLLSASYPDKSPSEIIVKQSGAPGVHFDFGI